jgi:prepilin-type N-terminal cleavage/methylation domain-containing protein
MKRIKSAFTMIELVFVIVVLGILAALALPRMERDLRTEAADNVLSAIRYTQHMALMDNVERPGANRWQRSFWRFGKEKCNDNGIFYYVGSDKDMEGNIDLGEAALDPANSHWMMGKNGQDCESDLSSQVFTSGTTASKNIFLTKLYGISEGKMLFSSSCRTVPTGKTGHIAFDYLGRPHSGITGLTVPNYSKLLTTDCNITLSFEDANTPNVIITIEKETGRAFIAN